MEGLKVSDADLVIYLHPAKSNKVSQAILRELGAMLLKFDEKFEGVLLAYEAKIIDKSAKILSGVHPYFAVTIKAKLLLFSPKPNMLLEGKVVKLKQESIHVIVLGFASAVITDEDISSEFKHITRHGEEMLVSRANKHHVIKVGTIIRFLVKSFDEGILHISGSLVPSHTGSIHRLDKNSVEGLATNKSKRKMREDEATDINALILNDDHQSKTKRQRTTRLS